MPQPSYIYTLFVSHVLESLPFLLLGIIISSGLLVFVDEHELVAKFPRSRILGVIIGSSLGLLLPVGQYGNIPVTRRLLLQGVSIPVCISFLIASPTINPFVILSSWQVLGGHPRLIFLRILGAWLIGIIIGFVFSTYSDKPVASEGETAILETRSTLVRSGTIVRPLEGFQPLHRAGNLIYENKEMSGAYRTLKQQLYVFVDNLIREFLELGSILILGAAISTAFQVFLPQAQLLAWGQTPLTQILVMGLLSLVISLNSLWAASFVSPLTTTLLLGSGFVFLLFNSLFNISSLALLFATIRGKAAIYLIIITTQLILLFAFVLNFYFG
ncbi:permease [Crocosphaera sp. XPORK-15E]|uniref:permease n=1 Tax=Crocosphaera sp. XPORK-15E TaxID=3110247 RepID=UPI002B20156A|nr:permease [Crocosphaera sp. XPORK-15E]MEA5535349.1 permease [Crocosphaera sp. XPORK-15E]